MSSPVHCVIHPRHQPEAPCMYKSGCLSQFFLSDPSSWARRGTWSPPRLGCSEPGLGVRVVGLVLSCGSRFRKPGIYAAPLEGDQGSRRGPEGSNQGALLGLRAQGSGWGVGVGERRAPRGSREESEIRWIQGTTGGCWGEHSGYVAQRVVRTAWTRICGSSLYHHNSHKGSLEQEEGAEPKTTLGGGLHSTTPFYSAKNRNFIFPNIDSYF